MCPGCLAHREQLVDERDRQEIGLFRYALIRDAADPALSKAERGRLVRALADREHVAPDGRLHRVARGTLDEWIRAYRHGGFQALVPRPRVVAPRTPAGMLELAFALKRERPERTAAQVREIMLAAGDEPVPGLRTLQTHLARQGLNVRADGRTPGKVYGRFEAGARNELWTGDGLHGPKLSGSAARVVLLAFVDDHSRMLVGWRWGTGEDVFRLEAALRVGLMARGVPDAILVDRGSAFVSSQLLRACPVLGVRLIHASPRAATTKGKIERFFRTVRDQFLVEIDDGVKLAELNRLFSAWLEVVYHRRVHSETGQAPLERFDAAGAPAPANIEAALKAASPLIGIAVCIGDRRPYNAALVVLDPEVSAGRDPGDPEIVHLVQQAVDQANVGLARVEQVKRFRILEGDWLPGGEELTPTMKLKRGPSSEKYAAEIEALYTT